LLGAAEDHFEGVEHQLRRAWRVFGNRVDMIFDLRGANRFQLPAFEDGEPSQRLAAARERGGPHALRITLQPSGDELRKRLRRRRVERAEGNAAVDLVAHDLGVALPRSDRLPAVLAVRKRLLDRPVAAASDNARLLPHRSTSRLTSRTTVADAGPR